MKSKSLTRKELENIITGGAISFYDSSPINSITLPPKTVLVGVQLDSFVGGVRGTMFVFRHDSNDTVLLNTDEYSFTAEGGDDINDVIGPLKTGYHHIDDFPCSMKDQVPRNVLERLEEIHQGNLTDSNFL